MAAKSMQDILDSGKLKTFIDPRIIKALGHPVREHALAVFNERTASGTEIGEELGADVSSFYHHIEVLEELGCVVRVESKGRRGAKEHFFRARGGLILDGHAWQELPASVKSDWIATHLQSIWDDVVAALQNGTFVGDDEPHVTWLPGLFDRVGREEAMAVMNAALLRLMTVRERSAKRIAATGESGSPATIALMRFATPR